MTVRIQTHDQHRNGTRWELSRFYRITILSILFSFAAHEIFADCAGTSDGRLVELDVTTCEALVAEKLDAVRKDPLYKEWNLKKLYTGALVGTPQGTWVYPTSSQTPCEKFPARARVTMRAYSTCCDTGRWGKCHFGGGWLGDIDDRPINAFQ